MLHDLVTLELTLLNLRLINLVVVFSSVSRPPRVLS